MVMCHDHEECLGTSHHQEQSFYTLPPLCRPQTGGRTAHARSRHHRWLEAQLVRGSRDTRTRRQVRDASPGQTEDISQLRDASPGETEDISQLSPEQDRGRRQTSDPDQLCPTLASFVMPRAAVNSQGEDMTRSHMMSVTSVSPVFR